MGLPLQPTYSDGTPASWALAHGYRNAKLVQESATPVGDLQKLAVDIAHQRNCFNGGTGVHFTDAIEKLSARDSLSCAAPTRKQCRTDYPYRSADGSCNNLDNPTYGMSGVTLLRLHPSAYDDGVNIPRRRSVTGSRLLSPRKISLIVNDRSEKLDHKTTHLFMQFGQFIDHDMMNTPAFDDFGEVICCAEDMANVTSSSSQRAIQTQLDAKDECFKIPVPERDPVFSHTTCMTFARSLGTLSKDHCIVGPRQQYNTQTAFIDGSHVYGASLERQRQLRSFVGGRLSSQERIGQTNLLPIAPAGSAEAITCVNDTLKNDEGCFYSGDARVNEQSLLASTHTLFMLEHNRVAGKLSAVNPHWNDERLYQEARKIVVAELQHITYSAFLPIALGSDLMAEYELTPSSGGHFAGYDDLINPSISTEFATGAFRFGHTLIRNTYSRRGSQGEDFGKVTFREHFFRPDRIYDDSKQGAGGVMRGMLKDSAEKFDRRFVTEIADYCYSNPSSFGFDLVALNTQRGRDHAIQPYSQYRADVGLSTPRSFEDLSDTHSEESIRKLAKAYAHVDDIDVYEGGLTEEPLAGALAGPMFSRMIAYQMKILKYGDRFFYETADKVIGFTRDQLNEIRKTSMSKIICENYGAEEGIQQNAFLNTGDTNTLISCHQLPDIDFSRWST